jgi:hypothetical protein
VDADGRSPRVHRYGYGYGYGCTVTVSPTVPDGWATPSPSGSFSLAKNGTLGLDFSLHSTNNLTIPKGIYTITGAVGFAIDGKNHAVVCSGSVTV